MEFVLWKWFGDCGPCHRIIHSSQNKHRNAPHQVHPDGGASGSDAPLSPLDSPFTGPLSTRTPRTDAALQAATSARAAGGVNSTTKYGELPPCVRASARSLLASAVVVGACRVGFVRACSVFTSVPSTCHLQTQNTTSPTPKT